MRNWAAWSRFILEREAIPFGYRPTAQDCVRFAAGSILSLTGIDRLRGIADWSSPEEAQALIEKIGGGAGLQACVDTVLTPIPAAHAHRGDLAGVHSDEFGMLIMVVEGPTLVAPGARRLRRAERSAMTWAWSAD